MSSLMNNFMYTAIIYVNIIFTKHTKIYYTLFIISFRFRFLIK